MKKWVIVLLLIAFLISACAGEYEIVCCKQWCHENGVCTPKVCKTVHAPTCSGVEWTVDTILKWPDKY